MTIGIWVPAWARSAVVGLGMSALLTACAPPAAQVGKPSPPIIPLSVAPPATATAPTAAAAVDTSTSTLGDPQSVERRAAAQAKAIAEIMAARNTPPDAALGADPSIPPVPIERPRPLPVPPPPATDLPVPARIAPAPVTPPGGEEPIRSSGANVPMSIAPSDSSTDHAPGRAVVPLPPRPPAGIEQQVADRATQNPRDVAAQLDQQLLQLVQGQPVPTEQNLAGLAQDDREMLTTLLDGLSNFRAGVAADSNMLMTRKIHPLVDMADRLRSESDLTLPTALLCSGVSGFGNYTAIEPVRFAAMTPASVVVYCEVSNFVSKIDEKSLYTTSLHQDLVLYTESGLPVWTYKDPINKGNVADICRNRRHDFFLATKILLPPTLGTGRHVLKVTVIDLNANHVAETSIPVAIIAK